MTEKLILLFYSVSMRIYTNISSDKVYEITVSILEESLTV